MLINIIGKFAYDVSMERYYLRAFRRLGHEVIVNSDEVADVTIVFKELPENCELTGKKLLIFTDHTSRFKDYFNSIKDKFDTIFLLHNEDIVDNKRIFFLPCSYDPEIHHPLKKDNQLYIPEDVLFVGTRTIEREFLTKIPYLIKYGSGWGERPDIDKVRELYSRAKIVINQHYKYDTGNMRDFECIGYKVFTLSDFSPFKSAITYKNLEDLKGKIIYYLEHEKEREEIIEKCWLEAKDETYQKRAKQILKIINYDI